MAAILQMLLSSNHLATVLIAFIPAGCHALPVCRQDVIFPQDKPIAPPGTHVIIMKGNLSPGGSVIKLSGKLTKEWRGPARVFDDEYAALKVCCSVVCAAKCAALKACCSGVCSEICCPQGVLFGGVYSKVCCAQGMLLVGACKSFGIVKLCLHSNSCVVIVTARVP